MLTIYWYFTFENFNSLRYVNLRNLYMYDVIEYVRFYHFTWIFDLQNDLSFCYFFSLRKKISISMMPLKVIYCLVEEWLILINFLNILKLDYKCLYDSFRFYYNFINYIYLSIFLKDHEQFPFDSFTINKNMLISATIWTYSMSHNKTLKKRVKK